MNALYFRDEFDNLNTTVIPGLRKDQTQWSDKVSALKSTLEEDENRLKSLKEEESVAKPCLTDLAQIDVNVVSFIIT